MSSSMTIFSDGVIESLFLVDFQCWEITLCNLTIFFLYPNVSQVFQDLEFLASSFFKVRVHDLGPCFRRTLTLVHIFSYIEEEKM